MPEIAEVHTLVSQIEQEMTDRKCNYVSIDYLQPSAIGSPRLVTTKKPSRKGKFIHFYNPSDKSENQIILHLGMTGRLRINLMMDAELDKLAVAYQHTRGILTFHKTEGNRPVPEFRIVFTDPRNFGRIESVSGHLKYPAFQKLGIDVLSPDFTVGNFINSIRKHDILIAEAIVYQHVIAGLGNYMRSECLFEAGIRPDRKVSDLEDEELRILYRAILVVVDRAISAGGCSFRDYRDLYGNKGQFQNQLAVYQRHGGQCLDCGSGTIQRGKTSKTTFVFFCPNCQM